MFENLITTIKRRFSKTSDEIIPNLENEKKESGLKKSLQILRTKFLKAKTASTADLSVPNYYESNASLSPRAAGAGECAQTEIEWPNLCDNNPNILDKFTRIVTTVDYTTYDRNV